MRIFELEYGDVTEIYAAYCKEQMIVFYFTEILKIQANSPLWSEWNHTIALQEIPKDEWPSLDTFDKEENLYSPITTSIPSSITFPHLLASIEL